MKKTNSFLCFWAQNLDNQSEDYFICNDNWFVGEKKSFKESKEYLDKISSISLSGIKLLEQEELTLFLHKSKKEFLLELTTKEKDVDDRESSFLCYGSVEWFSEDKEEEFIRKTKDFLEKINRTFSKKLENSLKEAIQLLQKEQKSTPSFTTQHLLYVTAFLLLFLGNLFHHFIIRKVVYRKKRKEHLCKMIFIITNKEKNLKGHFSKKGNYCYQFELSAQKKLHVRLLEKSQQVSLQFLSPQNKKLFSLSSKKKEVTIEISKTGKYTLIVKGKSDYSVQLRIIERKK